MQTWNAGVEGGRVAGVAPAARRGGRRRPRPRWSVAPRNADEEARTGGGGTRSMPGRPEAAAYCTSGGP